jgi:hypothetical protein
MIDQTLPSVKTNLKDIAVVRRALRLKSRAASANLGLTIGTEMLARADDMFIWAFFVMGYIRNKESKEAALKGIEAMPLDLEAMIAHVFDRLN